MNTPINNQTPQVPAPWWEAPSPYSGEQQKALYEHINSFFDSVGPDFVAEHLYQLVSIIMLNNNDKDQGWEISPEEALTIASHTAQIAFFFARFAKIWHSLEWLSLRDCHNGKP
ncbi:hypothetical protein GCM10027275_30640 [Rhabdobacter roseus]|uniref:Uncharacterized protein n=1 Tax=Rhabdobacter roseus TaxID=1655419 RepID=A0A840TTZ1_9BACT|nr:hypothetical protein [Rhabdobacter roseus]MBB5285022.1 hypothetical protein [Rhabdobacter roseus]